MSIGLRSLTLRLRRYSNGTREYTTNLYDPSANFPRGLIGPATFIWDVPSTEAEERHVLVRLHPTINKEAHRVLSHVASLHQTVATSSRARAEDFVTVRALEKELLTFEVTGRRATEVVKAVLKPTLGSDAKTKQVGFLVLLRPAAADLPHLTGLAEAQRGRRTRQRAEWDGLRSRSLRPSFEV